MAYEQYTIEIIRKNLTDSFIVQDFKRLKIIDILNGIGTWSVSSVTEDPCPFTTGDFVRIRRGKTVIFGGCLTSYEEEYSTKLQAWQWTASGKSFMQILQWKLIFPPYDVFNQYLSAREWTDDMGASFVILSLIDDNVCGDIGFERAGVGGFDVVLDTKAILPIAAAESGAVNYRFDNVYEAVSALANEVNYAILPVWVKDSTKDKIIYCVTSGSDLSATVVFRTEYDQINSFRHIYSCPEATDIICEYNGEDGSTPIWRYVCSGQIQGAADWRAGGQIRELHVKPKKQDFDETFTKAQLQALCDKTAAGMDVTSDCYEADLNVQMMPYTYGYDWKTTSYEQFSTDYRLGDKIGISVNGETYTGRLTKMEFDVAYGKESIRPTIGGIEKGILTGVVSNLKNLNRSTGKTDTTEVS